MVNICLRLQSVVSLIDGDMQGACSSTTNPWMCFPVDPNPWWTKAMVVGNDLVDVGNEEWIVSKVHYDISIKTN